MKNARSHPIPPWLIYGVLYFLSAYGGWYLTTPDEVIFPFWFAAGFALVGTLLHGYRVLLGIWLGACGALLLHGLPAMTSGIIALGEVASAFIAVLMLHRVGPPYKLLRATRHLIYFLLFAVLIAPVASAASAVSSLFFSGLNDIDKLLQNGLTWWLSEAAGIILITPLMLAWITQKGALFPNRRIEGLLLTATTLLIGGLVSGELFPSTFNHYPISYLPFPLLAWVAIRFRHRATTTILLLIACFALWGTYSGQGPFVRENWDEAVRLLQIYIVIMSATTLIFRAITSERQQVMNRLTLAAKVISHTPDGIIVTNPKGTIISANPAFFSTTGFRQNEVLGKPIRHLTSVHHSRNFFTRVWEQAKKNDHWEGEIWSRNRMGEIVPQWLILNAIRNNNQDVTHYLGIYSDVSRQKQVQERIHRLAYYDVLTGLPNRQLFTDRLNQAIKYAGRHTSRLALFFLDLDRFKNINDTLGHSIGDRVLQLTSERLSECVRQTDTLSRLGGDEFTIIVQDVNEDFDTILVAEKVIKAFRNPLLVDEHELFLTPSIGISLFPDDGDTSEELIKHADTAMYQAKELGGNGFQFFAADMSDPIRWNLTVETALRRAIEQSNIQVLYQPQFELRSGNIVGLEALARWHHKGTEETPPDVFIKVAEDTGLIHRLGDLILEIACKQSVQWRKEGIANLRIAVNISPLQLKQDEFSNRLRRIVDTTGATPQQIELEITETTLMENAGLMENLLTQFSAQGFQIAVDDFGTGYSSLSYLKRLSIDRIKIDQSFIRDIPGDSNDTAICSAIISMAHSLKLNVIAEGVETDRQMDFLRRERCDEIQGYLFSQPVSPKEVSEMIRQGYWHTE